MPWKIETNSTLGKTGSRFSFSRHLALNRRPVLADQKVKICVLYLNINCPLFFHLSARENSSVIMVVM